MLLRYDFMQSFDNNTWHAGYHSVESKKALTLGRAGKNEIPTSSNHTQHPSFNQTSKGVTTMYVVSLQGVEGASKNNDGRLDGFLKDWFESCGDAIQFKVCPGVIDPRRGYGLTQSYVTCFERALADGEEYPVFFEDDARLFSGVEDFCNADFRSNLWEAAPIDSMVLMLGGHTWKYGKQHHPEGFKHVKMSHGTYGFAVPRDSLRLLRDGYVADLYSKAKTLSPDISWFKHAKKKSKKIYVTYPLIVRHVAGYSNTWDSHRGSIDDRAPQQEQCTFSWFSWLPGVCR